MGVPLFGLVIAVAAAMPSRWQNTTDAIDEAVLAEIVRQDLVGVAVGVVDLNGFEYIQGYGLASIDANTSLVGDLTMLRWASVAKTMTAVVAARLEELGVVDLDADIGTYYPDYTANMPGVYAQCINGAPQCLPQELELLPLPSTPKITLRLLLTHRAGIQHYSNGYALGEPPAPLTNDPEINTGMEWALPYFWANPFINIPGTERSYSTFAYNLAGVVLEKATGEPFKALVEQLITKPAGISSLLQPDYEWVDIPHRAVGYNVRGEDVGSDDVSWKLAGGGYISTVQQMMQYCRAMMGTEVASEELKYGVLWQPNEDKQGLGWFLDYRGDILHAVYHSGSQQKTATKLMLYLEDGVCVTVMSNSEHMMADAMVAVVAAAAGVASP